MKSNVDNPFKSPSLLSLCSGMRGLERGLERVIGSVTVAAYVEIEAFIIYNLVRQMEIGYLDAAPVWSDLKTFPSKEFHGKIHWIIGGYPCQPFSVAGLQQGTDDPRHLWPYIKESISIIKPSGCFFENVANHLNIGYREVRRDLEEMGYTVKEGIYSAEEAGAPHERKRLFILALSTCELQHWIRDERRRRNEHSNGSEKLENANNIGCRSKRIFTEQQGSDAINVGESVANSDNTRLQGRISTELSECTNEFTVGQRDSQVWPAGQGEYQYAWEEPRTVEPGVGCTIDGYNFRTDLLRMYGNGVVEQTAELAFVDLLNKHLK